ncbi:MAG TPA: glycosyltransferase family 9 protein [Bacteroidia bacterium]|nr:glycosyltransferase family 9 protein [Bacteroidia bacterium]
MKILIIRFSSIGDIVLTTPVIRCCAQQIKNAEIHFVCKASFKSTLEHNPYIHKLITFEKDINEVIPALKKENYDVLVDLHNNLRSRRLKLALGKKSVAFDKLNVRKFLAVALKSKNLLPDIHIVQRYLQTVSSLSVKDDGKGLDYFISENDSVDLSTIHSELNKGYIALVVGGSYYTKKIPVNKLIEICNKSKLPLVLLGGKEDSSIAEQVVSTCKNAFNLCGKYSLNQSASIIQHSTFIITSDTGLMHIASAFGKKIYSLWGNTIPEFGMYPYKPGEGSQILEVKNLKCRPCSKLGYGKCPKGHFKCMNEIDVGLVGSS